MKKIKFVVSMLVVIALMSSVSVNAFAATAPTWLQNEFKDFNYLVQGEESSYVRILQRFLLNYNSTTGNYIINAGGVDGDFGSGTYNATVAFQQAVFTNSVDWDGKVGSRTWEKICINMDYSKSPIGESYVHYFDRGSNRIVYMAYNIWYVTDKWGTTWQIWRG